jgi:hypothetical protein
MLFLVEFRLFSDTSLGRNVCKASDSSTLWRHVETHELVAGFAGLHMRSAGGGRKCLCEKTFSAEFGRAGNLF